MSLRLSAWLDYDGNAQLCRFHGPADCDANYFLTGLLAGKQSAKGKCRSRELGALSAGFDLFHAPSLIEDGVTVVSPPCSKAGDKFSCVQWYPLPDPKPDERKLRMSARLFGYSDAPWNLPLRDPQPVENLVMNVHVGTRADLTFPVGSLREAFDYLVLRPEANVDDFEVRIGLNALENMVAANGTVVDKGAFGQLLPIRVYGRDEAPLLGPFEYEFLVDNSRFGIASVDGKDLRILELNAYKPKIRFLNGDQSFLPADEIRIRAELVDFKVTSEIDVVPVFDHVAIRLIALGGLLNVELGGGLLNPLVNQFLASTKIAKLNKSFDIAIPRCISVEGDHSEDELKTCTASGLLAHVAGSRGVRATIVQNALKVVDHGATVQVSGKMKFDPIPVGE